MATIHRRAGAAVLAALLAAAWGAALRADEGDASLREKALALNNVTGEKAMKASVVGLVKDKEGTPRLLARAAGMLKGKKDDQPLNVTATYILATAALGLGDLGHAETFYRANAEQAAKLQSPHKIEQAYGGLIDVLSAQKKYTEVEKACKQVLALEDDDELKVFRSRVFRRLVIVLVQQKRSNEALELLDKRLKEDPDNWLNIEMKAQLLREPLGRPEDSIKVYEELIDRVKDEKRLKDEVKEQFLDDLHYQLSGVYIDLNQVDKAAAELKGLLDRHPDNPTYNNDLGYIWVDHDMNVEESEKLIRKALDEDRKQRKANPDLKPEDDKDNPAFLDSLAWVLCKQKKYPEAKEILQKATADPQGQNIEILDHLAQVHQALGEKAEAAAVWKKALELPVTGKRDERRKAEVEKRLKANE
jgi:tetratricopeptide (TPR) repeat protein